MSLKRSTLLVVLMLSFNMAGCWEKPEQTRHLTDAQGRALILHGVNSSSSAKDPATGHMPWVTEADVRQETVDWGFNFVRLLIFWDGIEPERGVFDEAYLDAVEERVNWYAANGAFVMLDMHQDIYGHAVGGNGAPAWATETAGWELLSLDFPGMPWWVKNVDPSVIAAFVNFWKHDRYDFLQDHYIQSWQKVAERFKDHPSVIGYDLMNEPHAGDLVKAATFTFEPTWLKAMYDRLIPALRSIDEDKWIFFEPQSLAVNFGLASKLPKIEDTREGEARLAYAPHVYPFTLHEGVAYNLLDKQQMRDWNRHRTEELNLQQVPLLVGEFGGSDSTVGFRDYIDDLMQMLDHMGGSWAYWSNDPGGWGLLDADRNETPKVNHLVRAYPRAIAGEPESFSFDPESKLFSLNFSQKDGVDGVTEIFLPNRHYPNGWQLETSDTQGAWSMEWNPEKQILYYSADPESLHHSLLVRPLN